ncbi:MAG: NAD-binding protein [Planctomycetes bacterium]|nr:NAD-binding protein [Planctomycetota bacterium]
MQSRRRRFRAWLIYLRRPIREYLPLFGGLVLLLLLGGVAFYGLYDKRELSFAEAMFVTFGLILGEPTVDWPENPLLEVFYYLLPILGLVVVLDGIVRFSYYVFRRDEMSREWVSAMANTMSNHVILYGLGKVGFRILQQLVALKQQVVVIEKDPQCPNFAYARNHGVPVRVGNGREEGILEDVNVRQAASVICCTSDDLANLELAMDARKLCPDIRVVLRMYDQELAEKIRETMNIPLAFSTAMLSAPLFATASFDRSVINAFYVDGRLLVVARVTVEPGSKLAGMKVEELVRGFQLVVISQRRGPNTLFHPPLEGAIEAGDVLTYECDPLTLKDIHTLNRAGASALAESR